MTQDLTTLSNDELLEQGFIAFDNNQLDEAENIYGLLLARLDLDDNQERNAKHMLAFVKSHQGDFDTARSIYLTLLADARQRKDNYAVATTLHQ